MAGSIWSLEKLITITVVLWERNVEMTGVNAVVTPQHMKVFRPGSRGVLRVRCCSTDKTFGNGGIWRDVL